MILTISLIYFWLCFQLFYREQKIKNWSERLFELALGIGITLKEVQDSGIVLDLIRLFKIDRRRSSELLDKYNIIEDIVPLPEAGDLWDKNAEFNSYINKEYSILLFHQLIKICNLKIKSTVL